MEMIKTRGSRAIQGALDRAEKYPSNNSLVEARQMEQELSAGWEDMTDSWMNSGFVDKC